MLMSTVDLTGLEETRFVLSNSDALADIREADAAYAQSDVVRGVDEIRVCARERGPQRPDRDGRSEKSPALRGFRSGPCRDRTYDLGIKSPLLYQLS